MYADLFGTKLLSRLSDELQLIIYKSIFYTFPLQAFSELGIGYAFTPYANFTGFTGRPEVFLNSMNHQTIIEVNEDGTKASVAKTAFSEAAFLSNQFVFTCDRPFLYIIFDFFSSKVLITGTFRNPPA